MSFKVKNISITGSKITFTIPQGAVVTKIFGGNSGAYVLDKAYRYTIPLNLGKINVNNNLWGPITGEFTFPKGTAPHLNDASKREIPGMTIYAKCSGSLQNGHFKIVKFGVYLKDTGTSYIEDFNCQDDSYASALNCLLADGKTHQIMVNKDAIKQEEKPNPVERAQAKNIQGMPQNFAKNKANVATLQQYLVRMGEQQNIATKKVPSGVDGLYGTKTEAATKRVMKDQGWTWDQLWAQAVQYAKQIQGQQSQPQGQANQELAQVNPEAAEFANPQKLTAPTKGITQKAQPASAAQYAANASNVLQPKQVDVSAVKPKVMTESVEEVKEKFYDIFNRMNNATILQ